MTKPQKRETLILGIATAFLWMSVYAYMPILSPYSQEMGANYTLVGLILSSYGFTQLILRIPCGLLSDHLGRRRPFILLSAVASLVSCAGLYLAQTPLLLLISRSMAGVAMSAWSIYIAAFTSRFRREEHSKAVGILQAITTAGQLVGSLAGGLVSSRWGQPAVFLVAGVGAAMSVVLSLLLNEDKAERKKPLERQLVLGVLADRDMLVYSIIALFVYAIIYTGPFGFNANLLRELGAGDAILGLSTALVFLPGIFSASLTGTWFRRNMGARGTLILGLLAMGAAFILTVYTTSIPVFLTLQAVAGFARGLLTSSTLALASRNMSPEIRSTGISIHQEIYGIGQTCGAAWAGWCADRIGMTGAFWVMLLLVVAALIMTITKKDISYTNE